MNEESILREFNDAEAILKGHFILSSGLHSDTYLQCARVLMDPVRAERLCNALAQKIKAQIDVSKIDMVASPAMGGVVVGYEIARQLGKPSIFCERENGQFTLRRGFYIEEGMNILVVEDVITTGKSSLEAINCFKQYGANIIAEACLIDRSGGNSETIGLPIFSLLDLDIKTHNPDNLPAELSSVPAIKPGSRWLQQTK